MNLDVQLRSLSIDFAIKLLTIHGKGGRTPRAGEVIEIAKVFNGYISGATT